MNTHSRKPSMIHSVTLSLAPIALALLVGCSSMPAGNAQVEQARSDLRMAQNDPQTRDLAVIEMKHAGDAVALATAAWNRGDSVEEIEHLAQLARTRVAIAQEVGRQRASEAFVAQSATARDAQRLAARTAEADAAQRGANVAQREAGTAQREAGQAQRAAATAQAQSTAAQSQANAADARSASLEAQLVALNATKTDRGIVIPFGDVLFETNRSDMKSGARRGMERVADFMKQNPKRKALIEGYTDSVGSDSSNQMLSARRADAVRIALVQMGVSDERLTIQGNGGSYPLASNDTAEGRQRNRRVEIVLSDEVGYVRVR